MKTFKFLLLTLLLMCGLMAYAQKVVVYKKDGTRVEYNASEVKDVKYKKAEVVYYYYVGWNKPTTADELKKYASDPDETGVGGKTSTLTGYTKDAPLCKITSAISVEDEAYFYVVIPDSLNIYDTVFNVQITNTSFTKINTISLDDTNYNIYQFNDTGWDINSIAIYN